MLATANAVAAGRRAVAHCMNEERLTWNESKIIYGCYAENQKSSKDTRKKSCSVGPASDVLSEPSSVILDAELATYLVPRLQGATMPNAKKDRSNGIDDDWRDIPIAELQTAATGQKFMDRQRHCYNRLIATSPCTASTHLQRTLALPHEWCPQIDGNTAAKIRTLNS